MSARLGIGDGCLTPRVIVSARASSRTTSPCWRRVRRVARTSIVPTFALFLTRRRSTREVTQDDVRPGRAPRTSARFRAATRDPGGDPTADLSTLPPLRDPARRGAQPPGGQVAIPRVRSCVRPPRATRSRTPTTAHARGDPPRGRSPISGEDHALYAAFPCVRVQQPCDFHTIRVHVDGMYNHPEGSINCWLPLTTTSARTPCTSNLPRDAEDFEPLDMRPGQIAVFDGTTCAHYTLANTTERTRVSLDFGSFRRRRGTRARSSSRVPGGGRRSV